MSRAFTPLLFLLLALQTAPRAAAADSPLFDPNPTHPWNLIHDFFYGVPHRFQNEAIIESLDLPVTSDTLNLLIGPEHTRLIARLNLFIAQHQENLIPDPLKRAIMQHDLWSAFDWAADDGGHPAERREILTRLAVIIRRLALSPEQIAALPDSYALAASGGAFPNAYDPAQRSRAFLPTALDQPDGPWVPLIDQVSGRMPLALNHVQFCEGRSYFDVYASLPGGRTATVDYLKRLSNFPRPWAWEPAYEQFPFARLPVMTNPEIPNFPIMTSFALVRRMLLIDDRGNIVPTRLTEAVQIRVYRTDPARAYFGNPDDQDSYEFQMRRAGLLAGKAGGLRPVGAAEKSLAPFLAPVPPEHGRYAAAPRAASVPQSISCGSCHASPGVGSVLSYSHGPSESVRRPPYLTESSDAAAQSRFTLDWKKRTFAWGLLSGLGAQAH